MFAIWDDKVQIGCQLGRLEKLVANGGEIVEEVDADGCRHKVIRHRFCNAVRPAEWAEKQGDASITGLKAIIDAANKTTVTGVVWADRDTSEENIWLTLDSLTSQRSHVTKVVVVFRDDYERAYNYASGFQSLGWIKMPWGVRQTAEPSNEQLAIYCGDTWLIDVDDAVSDLSTRYYAAAVAGHVWEDGFFANLDDAINQNLERILCIRPRDGETAYVAQREAHELVGRNWGRAVYLKCGDELTRDYKEFVSCEC